MIADNRLTENAEWDDQLLGEQLKILCEAELDFSLEATGFEKERLISLSKTSRRFQRAIRTRPMQSPNYPQYKLAVLVTSGILVSTKFSAAMHWLYVITSCSCEILEQT